MGLITHAHWNKENLISWPQNKKSPTVAEEARRIGWEKHWNAALDEGAHCIGQNEMRGLVKTPCHKCFGDASSCPCEHYIRGHAR